MARSLNANWLASMRAGVSEVRYLVEIAVTDALSYKFTSGLCDNFDYPALVSKVAPISRSLDVFERTTQVGATTVEIVKDAEVDDIITGYRLLGKKVVIKIGTAELVEGDFENVMATGIITDDPDSNPADSAGLLTLNVKDPIHILQSTKILGYWYGDHPLDAIEDIIANKVGMDASMYVAADYTPSTYTDMSHFVVGRYGIHGYILEFAMNEPTSAMDVINELAAMVDGMIFVDEDGRVRFKVFDATTAATEDWTADDFANLKVVTKHRDFVNRIEVTTSKLADDKAKATICVNDTDSQSDYAWPGTAERVVERKIQSDWLNGYTSIGADWTDVSPAGESAPGAGDGDQIVLRGGMLSAVCGTRWPGFPAGVQPNDAKIAAGRLLTMRIGEEFVTFDSSILNNTSFRSQHAIYNPEDDDYDTGLDLPNHFTVRVKDRGAFGSTPAAHSYGFPSGKLIDVTIARSMGERRLARFGDGGVDVIACETDLSHANVEQGDFVTLTTARFKGYGDDGLSTTTKWEAIGKAINYFASPPRIDWELAWATKVGAAAGATTHRGHKGFPSAWEGMLWNTGKEILVNGHVSDGMVVAIDAGLTVSLSAGFATGQTGSVRLLSATSITLRASKTSWIYYDTESPSIVIEENAAEPTAPASLILLSKVVTGAAAVTSIDNTVRTTTAVDGDRLHDSTVDTLQLHALAVTSAELDAAAVTAGKIATGGVSASTQIATGTVGVEQSLGADVRSTINRNSHFGQYTRG